jgi:hypothetical protein
MKKSLVSFILLTSILWSQQSDPKGAIIIAALEGEVSVLNNLTQIPVPKDQIKAGGLIFDGHTVKTGPAGKIILLMSNGTVSTIKSNSSLNIKQFTQEKFDPGKKKLSEMKGEPSSSNTIMNLEMGDMILDVKKLDKGSNFNVESPVGTAGIRGTIPYFQVTQAPDGGFQQVTSMLKGEIAFTPRGGSGSTLLGPGQSLSIGIGANGILLPPSLGKAPQSLLTSIEAEIEASGDLTGVSSTGDAILPSDADSESSEEDAPSEEELNEADDSRGAAAKGVDDNGSEEAVALDKAGLIDLDNEDQLAKVDSYVEVSSKAANKLEEKVQARRSGRRNGDKNEDDFISDLSGNFNDVVDVTIEAEALDIKDEAMFDSLLESSENAADVKEVVTVAADIGAKDKDSLESVFKNVDQADAVKEVVSVAADLGAQDKENLGAVFKNADKAEDLKEVMEVAKETLGSDDGTGTKKLDSSKASILSSTLQNADKADSMKSVMEDAAALGAQDAENLTSVFANADKADDLKEVMAVAKETLGTDDGSGTKKLDSSKASILSSTLKNADKADSMKSVMEDAAALGAQDADNLTAVFANADKADDLKEVMAVAKETLGTDDGSGTKKLDSSKASILSSTLKNADKADSMKSVMEDAAALGAQDADNLTAVFANADKADDLKEVMAVAKETLGTDDGTGTKKLDSSKASILSNTLKNADKASELKEVMETSADLGLQDADNLSAVFSNADKASELKAVMDVAKETLGTDDGSGSKKLDASSASILANTLQNADKAAEMKEVMEASADLGIQDAATLTSVFSNADKVDDLKAVMDVAKESLGTDDGTGVKKFDASSASILANTLKNADKASDLREVVAKAEESGASSSLSTMLSNADKATDLKEVVAKAEASGASASLGTMFANADKATDLKEVVAKAEASGASASLGTMFANADKASDLKAVVASAEASGAAAENLSSMFANAEKATDYKKVTDQLDGLGFEGGNSDIFANLDDVAEVFATVAGEGEINADAAKNILGNAAEVQEMKKAIDHAKEAGADLAVFAQKDVAEQKAVNEVVEKLKEAGGDGAATSFLQGGIDDALQLSQAFEDGNIDVQTLADSVSSGNSVDDAFKAGSLTKLNERFSADDDFLEAISVNSAKSKDILFALSFVEAGSADETALMGNLDKLDSIMYLSHRFEQNPERMQVVFQNLDVANSLEQLVYELGFFPSRLDIIFENADLAPAILATYRDYELLGDQTIISEMFSSSEALRNFLSNDGLSKLIRDYPEYTIEIQSNSELAGEIVGMLGMVGAEYAGDLLANLDKFEDLSILINRTSGNRENLESLFNHISFADELRILSDKYTRENITGGQDALFSSLDLFKADPGYFLLAQDDPKFFVRLSQGVSDLSQVSSTLAYELQELGLTRDELFEVLSDIIGGPLIEAPNSAPPSDDITQEDLNRFDTLSLGLSHVINGQIDPSLVIATEVASASGLFEDFYFAFSELSALDGFDSVNNLTTTDVSDSISTQPIANTTDTDAAEKEGILGGSELTIKSGRYDLSGLGYDSLIFASSDNISISGELLLSGSDSMREVLFVSAGTLQIEEGTSIDFSGESLGLGSFESLQVINVDLKSEGEIGLRSLEDLVISNSLMSTTNGLKSDFVHLLAYQQMEIDNLRFSEQVKQITMEAMTINLMNLNFPNGSEIQLNSQYGPLQGKYPNFNTRVFGRVNFIENIRYNNNLINSNASFDQFGSSISIGKIAR